MKGNNSSLIVNINVSVFQVGAVTNLTTDRYCDGDLDNIWVWKRKLTDAERTDWYNGGDGIEWKSLI